MINKNVKVERIWGGEIKGEQNSLHVERLNRIK